MLALVSALAVIAGATTWASAAAADFRDVPETGTAGRLVLASDPWPAQFTDLAPGRDSHWQIAARLEDADRATLSLQFTRAGELAEHPRGLTLSLARCAVPWELTEEPTCASGESAIAISTPADGSGMSPTFQLDQLAADAPTFLLVTMAVDRSPEAAADDSLHNLEAHVGVGLTAVAFDDVVVPPPSASPPATAPPGEEPPQANPPGPDGALPVTGGSASRLLALGLVALGVVGVGLSLGGRRDGLRGPRRREDHP